MANKKIKKTPRQKIGIACMITGFILIVHFLWLNFYGIIYYEVYSFLYDHFWEDNFDEESIIFDIGDIPDIFFFGSELIAVNNTPVLEIDEDAFASEGISNSEKIYSQNTTVHITMNSQQTEKSSTEKPAPTVYADSNKKVPLVMPKVYSREDYKDGYMILYVPRLGVQSGVMNGTGKRQLDKGPSLYEVSDLPTDNKEEDANVLLAAHRDGSKANFYNMHRMKSGDKMYLYINNFCYIYEYEETRIVESDDWSAVNRRGYNCITLTSCHPVGNNTHRIVVYGRLIDVKVYEPLV